MNRTRPTVADILALRGKRQLTMLYVDKLEEAEAAAEAGIDLLSIPGPVWTPAMREAAGDCFVQVGYGWAEHLSTFEDYLRAAHQAIRIGGDSFYCASSLEVVHKLAEDGVPVVGHVGLIPSKRTWTGGFRAVGKTADSALKVYRQVKDLEAAGAFGVEIEVVPPEVTAEITRRTSLLMISMGAGTGGHAQYLFAEDVLGYTPGHTPRHAKVYRDFKAEMARLQRERVAAFADFRKDVASGAYPQPGHLVPIAANELEAFRKALD